MKKKLYSFTVIISLLILIINIFVKSSVLTKAIIFSVNLFIQNILPSLFPMFVISYVLVEMDFPVVLGNMFRKTMNILFKTKGESAFVFFMSMITGFPSSSKYINDLIDRNLIDEKDAEKILMFSFFSNPLFIVNSVGVMFLGSFKIGIVLLVSHILGNIVIGLLFRNYNVSECELSDIKSYSNLRYLNNKINNTNIFNVLIKGIKSSIETLISIFGIITFILIIINIIFKDQNSIYSIPIIGLIEMTSGLKYLSMSSINYDIKVLLSMFFISFGGLSVHLQIMSILNEKKVKYLPFLLARLIHGFISVFMIIVLRKVLLF